MKRRHAAYRAHALLAISDAAPSCQERFGRVQFAAANAYNGICNFVRNTCIPFTWEEAEQMRRLFTSESVTEGHPDKVCDQISDAILDEILKQDPNARVACETAVNTGLVLVTGEITTDAYVDIAQIARDTINEIGFDNAEYGFDGATCGVLTSIDEQSPDIAQGVDKALETRDTDESDAGAGDQGMVFGYASNETDEYMPMPAVLSHNLTRQLSRLRKDKTLPYLRPDGKAQVTVEYDDEWKPVRVDTIVVSTQHDPDVTQEQIREDVLSKVITPAIPAEMLDEDTKIFVNPTGRFVIGGPKGDSGLTGRKIIVDSYGGMGRHGGGAFSGKDPSKVDRSAAYAARHVAKNIVAAGLADKVEIQIAYAIGVANPVSIFVDTFGTGKISDERIADIVAKLFDLRPNAIIERLDLRKPMYKPVAAYGHFGRTDLDLPWERLDMVDAIKAEAAV